MLAFLEGATNDTLNLIIVIVGIILIVGVAAALAYKIVTVIKKSQQAKERGEKAEKVAEPEDIAADEYLEEMEQKGEYLVMSRHVIYSAGEDGQLLPGKYVIKCAAGNEGGYNMRVNGLVREFQDGETIVLGAGDTVCPVSHSVLIKSGK